MRFNANLFLTEENEDDDDPSLDKNHRECVNMLEYLPSDVMVNILTYMGIPSRVKLAGCNKNLRKRVFEECNQAWVEILFYTKQTWADSGVNIHLTDFQLHSLLTRVNAWQVTRTLDLGGCGRITSRSLVSLTRSPVLQVIYLWKTSNEFRLLWPPLLLPTLIYARTHLQPTDTRVTRYIRRNQIRQAKRQQTPCDCCKLPVVTESRQLVPTVIGEPMLRV